MKKTLLSFAFAAFAFLGAKSQTISIVGTGVNGWAPANGTEITLSTIDNVTYTITDLVVNTGEVKFRQDLDWLVNWGSNTWPSGTGTQGGANIPTVAGTYDVTFNRVTGAYSFEGSAAFDAIGVWGPAVDPTNGFSGNDVEMITSDGITYRLSGFTFSTGAAKFLVNNNPSQAYGGDAFPSGTAALGGGGIPVLGGAYTVVFVPSTGAYTFSYPSIGLIGNAAQGWDVDIDMSTTNGELYTLQGIQLVDGFIKFRQDDSWTTNWGVGGASANILAQNGTDIPVTAGTYDVTFNRITLEWSLITSLSTVDNQGKIFKVFPNPTKSEWTIASAQEIIDSVVIFDLSGKVVYSANPSSNQFNINAAGFSSGTYFAKVMSANTVQNVKLVKE
jgi:hypothetical protein